MSTDPPPDTPNAGGGLTELCLNFYRGLRNRLLLQQVRLYLRWPGIGRNWGCWSGKQAAAEAAKSRASLLTGRETEGGETSAQQSQHLSLLGDPPAAGNAAGAFGRTSRMCCCYSISKSWLKPAIAAELMWIALVDALLLDYLVSAYPAAIIRPAPCVMSLLFILILTGLVALFVLCGWHHEHAWPMQRTHAYKHVQACMALCLCVACGCSSACGFLLTRRQIITPTESERELVKILITKQLLNRQPPGQLPSKTEFASRYEPFLLSLVHINLWTGKGVILAVSAVYHLLIASAIAAMTPYKVPPSTALLLSPVNSPLHDNQRRVQRYMFAKPFDQQLLKPKTKRAEPGSLDRPTGLDAPDGNLLRAGSDKRASSLTIFVPTRMRRKSSFAAHAARNSARPSRQTTPTTDDTPVLSDKPAMTSFNRKSMSRKSILMPSKTEQAQLTDPGLIDAARPSTSTARYSIDIDAIFGSQPSVDSTVNEKEQITLAGLGKMTDSQLRSELQQVLYKLAVTLDGNADSSLDDTLTLGTGYTGTDTEASSRYKDMQFTL